MSRQLRVGAKGRGYGPLRARALLGSVYISQLENGKKELGLRTIEIIATAFVLTPSQRGI